MDDRRGHRACRDRSRPESPYRGRSGIVGERLRELLAVRTGKNQIEVRRQVTIPIRYEDVVIEHGYRLDLLVGERAVVEIKAVQAILPVHRGQLLRYLKLGGFRLGFLLNFHVPHMRDGIVRMLNGF